MKAQIPIDLLFDYGAVCKKFDKGEILFFRR